MRFITGDECGVIKEYNYTKKLARTDRDNKKDVPGPVTLKGDYDDYLRRVNPHAPMTRKYGVMDMAWINKELQHFAVLTMDGSIQIWENNNSNTYQQVTEIPKIFQHTEDEIHRALGIHTIQNSNTNNRLCACNTTGKVVIVDPFVEEDNVVQEFYPYGKSENVQINANAVSGSMLAIGGKERETILWDVNVNKCIWKAKNLPADPQTLLQPQIWPTTASFINENVLVIGTAYHQIRVYDLRDKEHRRRPIAYTPTDESSFLQHRITAICPLQQNNYHDIVIGDSAGYMHIIDIRQLSGGRIINNNHIHQAEIGRFVGPAGSIRQITNTNDTTTLACVGLDRMLRIYDIKTRKQLRTIYMKQRLNCILCTDNDSCDTGTDSDSDDDGIDREDKVEDYKDSDNEEDDEDITSYEGEDDIVENISSADEDEASSSEENDSEEEEDNNPTNKKKRRRK